MKDENLFKTPPHSIEAEQSVIGGLMLDNEKLDDITVLLQESDFYTQQHQVLYKAILQLSQQSKPFDLVTVIEKLESIGLIEDSGGKAYLVDLVSNTAGSSNIKFYSEIVREKSILRGLIQVSNEISEASYFPQGKDIREVLDIAESKVMAISETGAGQQREYQDMQGLA